MSYVNCSACGVSNFVPAVELDPEARDAVDEMRTHKDAAYHERNQVVAALARLFPSGIARTAIEGWDEEWHGCVYIDLPTGQVSWHYHDDEAFMFEALPPYTGAWDGHTTEKKYARLAGLGADVDLVVVTKVHYDYLLELESEAGGEEQS